MQPKTIRSKNNGCGTAPGNLVTQFISISIELNTMYYILMRNKMCLADNLQDATDCVGLFLYKKTPVNLFILVILKIL